MRRGHQHRRPVRADVQRRANRQPVARAIEGDGRAELVARAVGAGAAQRSHIDVARRRDIAHDRGEALADNAAQLARSQQAAREAEQVNRTSIRLVAGGAYCQPRGSAGAIECKRSAELLAGGEVHVDVIGRRVVLADDALLRDRRVAVGGEVQQVHRAGAA